MVNCSPEDTTLLREILESGTTTVHCFNEMNHPMLSAWCSLQTAAAASAAQALRSSRHWLLTPSSSRAIKPSEFERHLNLALDRFGHHIYRSQDDARLSHVRNSAAIPLTLDVWHPKKLFEVTPTSLAGPFYIANKDEGAKLERAIHLSIGSVFPQSYVSPNAQDGKVFRELTDVLAFNTKSICVIEAKALAILSVGTSQRSSRRRANVEKDIRKALKQLSGALTSIRAGVPIYSQRSRIPIVVPNHDNSPAHAIVALSEMYAFVDWKAVAKVVGEASKSEAHLALFHVVDLLELANLAKNCHDAETFSNRLVQRWLHVQERGTAYVRTTHPPRST